MKTVITTILGVIAVLILAMALFIYSGVYNVAADKPHLPATEWVLKTTRAQSIAAHDDAVNRPQDLASDERFRRGAHLYGEMCQMCHLGPGIKPTPLHEGLNPKPPMLAKEASEHSPENLFWVVKHGIKMTGMPAWGETHGDQELWDIVAFLNKLPEMTPEQYKGLTGDVKTSLHQQDHLHE